MGKNDTKPKKSKTKVAAAKIKSPIKKSGGAKAKKNSKSGKNAEQVIMEALATFLVRGNETPERAKVSKATKLADKTVANALTKLKKSNYVIIEGKTLRLTDEGKAFLGPKAEKGGQGATNNDVHESLKEDMKKKEIELFEALLDGKIHDKDEIALASNYKDGKKTKTFMNMIGVMKTNGIIHYPDKDSIQLVHDTCFPWGSP